MAIHPQQQPGPQTGQQMTVKEYFQLDYTFPDAKYEYQDGKVRLMAGGSSEQDEIAFNIRSAIAQYFQSGPCFVRGSDLRVQVKEDGTYFYPECTISCNVYDRRRGNKLIQFPRVVIEVLSPSTESDDRGKKLKAYQACPTIQEIMLVDQFAPHVELYRRDAEDETRWKYLVYEPGDEVLLASVDVPLTFEEIYHGIDFDEPLIEE